MTYAWLLGVGLLMGLYQAIWWIVAIYLLIGVVLFLKWNRGDRLEYPSKPGGIEFIVVMVIISIFWPVAALTRNFCDGP